MENCSNIKSVNELLHKCETEFVNERHENG